MKVANCTQNTLPKQSFGMQIKFHPDDVAKGRIPIDCVDKMISVLTRVNATKEVADLAPSEVRIHYNGGCWASEDDFFEGKPSLDWLMKFEKFRPTEIKIRTDESVQGIITKLVQSAKSFAESIAEQKAQRAPNDKITEINAEKIRNAGLV